MSMKGLDEMIARCDAALEGGATQAEMAQIAADYKLAYERQASKITIYAMNLRKGPDAVDLAAIRSIWLILTAYRDYLDQELQLARAKSSNVTVNVSVSVENATSSIARCNGLSEEQRGRAMFNLKQAEEAAKEGDRKGFLDRAKLVLDIVMGIQATAPGVMAALGELAKLLG